MQNALIIAFSAVFVSMTITWLIQLKNKNAGIVDATWSYNFGLIAIIYFLYCNGASAQKMLMLLMVMAWSLRLGTFLFIRNVGKKEDARYTKLREDWGSNANIKMLFFFYLQGLLNMILSIPFLLMMQNEQEHISLLSWIGFVIWLMAICGEGLADAQLKNFKNNPDNKGKVCNVGLWNYSRHPNYFFEWMIWMGFFLAACSATYGWLAIISPIIILWTLLKATGIPMTEEQSIRTKGDAYREYQKTTSAFVPWFPKK